MSVEKEIRVIIEKLSLGIVMADKHDPAALKHILKILKPLLKFPPTPSNENQNRIISAAGVMYSYAEKAAENGAEEAEMAFDVLSRAAVSLQEITEGNAAADEVHFPQELGLIRNIGAAGEGVAGLLSCLEKFAGIAAASGKHQAERAAVSLAGLLECVSAGREVEIADVAVTADAWRAASFELTGAGAEAPVRAVEKAETEQARQADAERGRDLLNSDPALLSDFITEALEHAESAEKNMLMLERDSGDKEALNSVFRAFHTLKSLSGFLGLDDVHLLVKETENLLSKVRKCEINVNEQVMELLFKSVDFLKKMTDSISISLKTGAKMRRETGLDAHAEEISAMAGGKTTVESAAKQDVNEEGKSGTAQAGGNRSRETLKIDSYKLDSLIDTIGEIVIAESMINSDNTAMLAASNDYFKNISHLNKTTKRLHELGLALRLVPLMPVMHKMERVVRDLAKNHGKKINFIAQGGETEIDRGVVEKIQDPIMHMLRNAVDHGLEKNSEERKKAGKPEIAEIRINAFHRGGNVVIEVSDDGAGLDRDRILARAKENRLISADSSPTDAEIYSMIFKPGFSTARVVTDTSGRGVGMDVVKRNVEGLKGRVEIETRRGMGTKFSIILPITTAIIEAMVIVSDGDKFLLPTLSILESIRAGNDILSGVTGKGVVINLRGQLLPVFSLRKLFYGAKEAMNSMYGRIIVIVEDKGVRAGIAVDELLEQQQIVVKSLSKGIDAAEGISGCTIMSDGRVGLILDVASIIKMATGGVGAAWAESAAAGIK